MADGAPIAVGAVVWVALSEVASGDPTTLSNLLASLLFSPVGFAGDGFWEVWALTGFFFAADDASSCDVADAAAPGVGCIGPQRHAQSAAATINAARSLASRFMAISPVSSPAAQCPCGNGVSAAKKWGIIADPGQYLGNHWGRLP